MPQPEFLHFNWGINCYFFFQNTIIKTSKELVAPPWGIHGCKFALRTITAGRLIFYIRRRFFISWQYSAYAHNFAARFQASQYQLVPLFSLSQKQNAHTRPANSPSRLAAVRIEGKNKDSPARTGAAGQKQNISAAQYMCVRCGCLSHANRSCFRADCMLIVQQGVRTRAHFNIPDCWRWKGTAAGLVPG